MDETQEALIDGVELAIDWGLPVSEEDIEEYRRLIAYQQGRVDEKQQALTRQLKERRRKLDRLKTRVAAGTAIMILALSAWAIGDASAAIIFMTVAMCMLWKGE